MSQQQVGRKLRVDRTTVVKVVDSLASARLVSRKDDPRTFSTSAAEYVEVAVAVAVCDMAVFVSCPQS